MAAQDLDALIDELPDGDELPEAGSEETAQPEPDAAPAPPELKFAELDAVLPDDPTIPESYRKKSVAELARIAAQHEHEIGVARQKSSQYNALESRARVAEAGIDFLKQQMAASQPQRPPEPPEPEDQLLDRLSQRPGEVMDERVRQHVAPLEAQLQQLVTRDVQRSADAARERARVALGVSEEAWEAMTPDVAAKTAARGWHIEDPNAWYWAGRETIETAQRYFAPRPTAPPVVIPSQAPPPGGNARSQVRPTVQSKLKGRDKENAADLMDSFGIKDEKLRADFENHIATQSRRGAE